MDAQRYGRTDKGNQEIGQSKKTLPAKLRTVLFLIEADKDIREVQRQILLIGAPADSLEQLLSGGYVGVVGAFNAPLTAGAQTVDEQITQFRVAKAFMNETIVDARGIRAFTFTLKLERCATAADLATLLPDYTEGLLKKMDREAVRALVDRTRELIGAATLK